MRSQNLRDSAYARKSFYTHWRGWFKKWRWEYCISKDPFRDILNFEVTLGGEDECGVNLSTAVLGFSLYLNFYKLLPKKWAIGWFERDGVRNPRWNEDSHGRTWGFYWNKEVLHISWGSTVMCSGRNKKLYGRSWHFNMPWTWGGSVLWEVQKDDGSWGTVNHELANTARRAARKLNPNMTVEEHLSFSDKNYPDGRKTYTAPYKYVDNRGEVQKVTATFHVYRQEWRWVIFRNLPFRFGPKKTWVGIDIEFSEGIGEGCGTWKGGTVGCSYEMIRGETPLETLRRMEKERRFK